MFFRFWRFLKIWFSKFFKNKNKIKYILFFVKMKKYFCSRFFSMIWIMSLDFRKVIPSTRWCSSMLRWWIMFEDCFWKWKKISGFSSKIMLYVWIHNGFPRVSHYLQGTLPSLSELISKKNWSDDFFFLNLFIRHSNHQKKISGRCYKGL